MLVSVRANADSRPLRILMTADAVGGVWQYTVDLVRRLAEIGGEVLVAVLGPAPSDEQRGELEGLDGVALAEKSFALEWEPNSWTDVDASGNWLLELDSEFRSDLVHLNGYTHASLAWRKPVLVVAHSCVYSWWRNVLQTAPDPEWDEYRRRVTAGLLACDTVVAPTGFMAGEIQREYGVESDKVRVIHNFSRRPTSSSREKEPFFFAAGRVWDPAKNFALLEQAAPHLKWPVKLAGKDNGQRQGPLEKLGQVGTADLLELMSRAKVFVHPALYEPFGLSVLDAARSKCCLVLADIPSLRELWGDAALFIDPRDQSAWIAELNSLCDDPARCEELGERAFAHAQVYTAESSIASYNALYAHLIARDKGAQEAA